MSEELQGESRNSYRVLLTNFNFMKLWLAQIFSQLAANLLNFALIIRVFDLAAGTKYASISVSLLVLAFGIPSIIFALLAGAYVDHLDRK
ncbi:MAG: arabinose efflux permease, partial [Chryseobacterium sp.]